MPDNIPPKGDIEKAEKYITQLIDLVNRGKIEVYRTDLKKFDPTSLQDHYSVSLSEYQIEISHSKHQESEKNSFVMIFNNLKKISEGSGEKVILAYIYLDPSQFAKFKIIADKQIETRTRLEEEKRFKEAVAPIDNILSSVSGGPAETDKNGREENSGDDYSSNYPKIHQI